MSTFDYNRTAKLSSRLIKRFGKAVTWVNVHQNDSEGAYQPWKEEAGLTETQYTVDVLLLPVERDKRENISPGGPMTEQRKGNELAYCGQLPFTVTGRDYLIVEGKKIRIKSVDRYRPGTVDVLYELQLEL